MAAAASTIRGHARERRRAGDVADQRGRIRAAAPAAPEAGSGCTTTRRRDRRNSRRRREPRTTIPAGRARGQRSSGRRALRAIRGRPRASGSAPSRSSSRRRGSARSPTPGRSNAPSFRSRSRTGCRSKESCSRAGRRRTESPRPRTRQGSAGPRAAPTRVARRAAAFEGRTRTAAPKQKPAARAHRRSSREWSAHSTAARTQHVADDVAHRLDRLEHEDRAGGEDRGPARGGPRREAHPPSDQVHQHERQDREHWAHQERRGPPAEERARSRQMQRKPDGIERSEGAVPRAVDEAQRREGPGAGFGKLKARERVDRFDELAARERPRGVRVAGAVRAADREAGVAVEIGAVDREGRGDQEAARDARSPIRGSPHGDPLGVSVAVAFQSVSRSRRKTLMSPSA